MDLPLTQEKQGSFICPPGSGIWRDRHPYEFSRKIYVRGTAQEDFVFTSMDLDEKLFARALGKAHGPGSTRGAGLFFTPAPV